jgi:class 3 adenylate cyclase
LDCEPWCKNRQSGSNADCLRYWPPTWLAIRGSCTIAKEATHAKLKALLTRGVEPAIAEHGGRIVKNTGDGFLAEFPSAVEAVRAAVQFQTRIKELTISEVEDRRIAFRVGINIGDVIVEPHDIFGDGVNIAARLESIAEPGGVCISSSAYDQVRGKVG